MPRPLVYAQETALSGAKNLPSIPTGDRSYRVLVQAEAQAIRWRDDGTDPTASIGMIIPVNTVLEYDGDINKFRMIETTASAKANVSYYGV